MWPWELIHVHRFAHVMSTQGLSCVFALVDLTTEDDNFKAWPNPCFTMPEAGSQEAACLYCLPANEMIFGMVMTISINLYHMCVYIDIVIHRYAHV